MAKKAKLKKSLIGDKQLGRVVKIATKELVAFFISKVAFLAFGPFAWIISKFTGKFLEWAMKNTILGANSLIIDIDVGMDVRALDKVKEKVKLITEETTEEELDEIDKQIEDAARDLIKFARTKL